MPSEGLMRPVLLVGLLLWTALPSSVLAQAQPDPKAPPAKAAGKAKAKKKAAPAPVAPAAAEPKQADGAVMPTMDLSAPAEPPPPVPARVVEVPRDAEPSMPEGEPAATKEKKVVREPLHGLGLGIALKLALVIPSGRTTNVAADLSTDGSIQSASHSVTGGGALVLSYGLPFANRMFSLRVESGLYPLNGSGTRDYPNDPDLGSMSYSYKSLQVPLLAGVAVTIPLPIPLRITPEAGFASVWSRVVSSWTKDGDTVQTAPVSGWALGFYIGLELSWPIGPGAVVAEGRYVNARTGLGLNDAQKIPEYGGAYNPGLGDVQGTNVLVGYRFEL